MTVKSIALLAALLPALAGAARPSASASSLAALSLLLLPIVVPVPAAAAEEEEDDNPSCPGWAAAGECALNPQYMQGHCAESCRKRFEEDRTLAAGIEAKIGHIESFYELEADDIDKNPVTFDRFKGKVVVITNVASYCGYTEPHYRGLVELYERFRSSPVGFEILAFPCNQFGEQEPKTCPEIKRFAASKGVEFSMMDKVDVNGLDAHPAYHYLKKVAGPPHITWNFATYYVVSPTGTIRSFNGVAPLDLAAPILEAMGADDVGDDDDDYAGDDEEEEEEEL